LIDRLTELEEASNKFTTLKKAWLGLQVGHHAVISDYVLYL